MNLLLPGLLALVTTPVAAPPAAAARPALAEVAHISGLLEAGELEKAEAALGDPAQAARLPGLLGAVWERKGGADIEQACRLYEADARQSPARKAAASLRAARCLARVPEAQERAERVRRAFQTVLDDPMLGRDVLIAEEAAGALEAAGMPELATSLLEAWVLDAEPHPSDTERREAHARLVLLVHARGSEPAKKKAEQLLYVELAETRAASTFLKKAPARLRGHRDKALALARAEVLSQRHATKELLNTLSRWAPASRDVSDDGCHIRYLTGKARRKQRRYRASRADLDVVASRCGEPWRKKARYLAARVATFQGAKDAEAVLDRFLGAYPKDSLTDDVLVWKAELLKKQKRFDEADKAYARVALEHPTGDMLHGARFDRAFLRAQRGDADGAITLLDEIARTSLKASPIVSDQALYWSARLSAFPNLKTWDLTDDLERRARGLRGLAALATSRPASFYGHLARLVVLEVGPEAGLGEGDLNLPSPGDHRRNQGATRISLDGAFASEPRFEVGKALAGGGYVDEAALVLDPIDVRALDEKDAVALSTLYALVGRLDRSHQVMRKRGYALPPGKPAGSAASVWSLAFPRAHVDALTEGATQAGLPPALMIGLSREESAFQASVVSWAGAIGLCQLMPSTAREEARLARIKGKVDLEALRQPALNARLGANHLSRRLKQLKHPLLAIAAYNAGPGRVKGWVRASPPPVDTWVEEITVAQTRNYVKKVTGSWVTYSLLDHGQEAEVSFSLVVK